MNVNRFRDLKTIYCRAHHLLQGFDSFLSLEQQKDLQMDSLSIAMREYELNLLDYISVR